MKNETFDVFGVQHTVKEKWIGKDKLKRTEIIRQTLLETKYDSIFFTPSLGHPFWQTWCNGKRELHTVKGKLLLDGKALENITPLGEYPYGSYFVNEISPVHFVRSDNGCYLLCGDSQFGPYQFIYPGVAGYFYAENDKLGFCADQYERNIYGLAYKNKYTSKGIILPPEFESVIEVRIWGKSSSYNTYLGLKDGKWQAFDCYGKKTSISPNKLKIYTSLPVSAIPTHYMEDREKGTIHRYGTTGTSVVIIY